MTRLFGRRLAVSRALVVAVAGSVLLMAAAWWGPTLLFTVLTHWWGIR